MAVCDSEKSAGKDVVVEYAVACGDVNPNTLTFLPIGAMRGKALSTTLDTIDVTADDSVGAFRETLTTFKNMTFTGDGISRKTDGATSNQVALYTYVLTDENPVAWFRFTFKDLTITAFMVITAFDREAPYDDAITFSLEATVTASDFGVIVEVTP